MNQELVQKYLKGETLPEENLVILSWIEASTENRKEFMQFRRLYDSAIWSENKVNPSGQESNSTQKYIVFRYVREWMKVAAVIAFAVTGTLVFQKVNTKLIPSLTQTIEVPLGQHVNLTLSDGTKVSLNSNSKFQFPSTFDADSRKVILDGEGYFEVAHNAKKPFHVITKKCDVKVLGTKFNVLAYNNSQMFETSLLQGSVQINDLKTNQKVIMNPNEKIEIQNGIIIESKLENENDLMWRTGIYVFKNEPLAEIFQKMESYYQTKITIKNTQIGKLKCTGKFRQKEGIEDVVKVLKNLTNFNFKINKETNEIVIL